MANMTRPCSYIGWHKVTAAVIIGCLTIAGCAGRYAPAVTSIDIIGFGILEYDRATSEKDLTSSIGAELFRAQRLRLSQPTDRIPLRTGLTYGVAFVVHGTSSGVVNIKVVLRSSNPCILKETRQVVYQNDSVLQVRIGELRHIGGKFVPAEEDQCLGPYRPGTNTFELYYGDRKLAEKTFQLVPDDTLPR